MRTLSILLLAMVLTGPARGDPARVAVATNFLVTAQALVARFEAETGHRIDLVSGATGALYAQILQGAPYDLFLSADVARVDLLDRAGRVAARRPYAIGALVLWTPRADLPFSDIATSLRLPTTRRFAMADPATAPYGQAARQVLQALDLGDVMAEKAVIGTNVGQAFAYVATGNAQMGLVALSQVIDREGAWTAVPEGLHDPVVQAAALLTRGAGKPAAVGFFDYLASPAAGVTIRASGYTLPQ